MGPGLGTGDVGREGLDWVGLGFGVLWIRLLGGMGWIGLDVVGTLFVLLHSG